MRELLKKGELAQLAGVSPSSVSQALKKGRLSAALTPDGRRLYADHSAVSDFIGSNDSRRRQPATPVIRTEAARPAPVDAGDSLKQQERVASALYEIQAAGVGQLPQSLDDLGSMTLRHLVTNFGTLKGLSDSVKASKDFASMINTEGISNKRRSILIDRKVVASVLVPLIELSYRRLVNDVPTALTGQIVARVQAGGDDVRIDVEELIRSENGRALRGCRDSVVEEIANLERDSG